MKDPRKQFATLVDELARQYLSQLMSGPEAAAAAGRLTLALRSAAAAAPKLLECPPSDVAQGIAMCAITGLMPGGLFPDCYLIPRNMYDPTQNKKRLRATWQASARGLRKLVEREGWRLRVEAVHDGDELDVELGLTPRLAHRPDYSVERDWSTLRAMYVVAERPDGSATPAFRIIPRAVLEARRAAAESDKVWGAWPLEMAEKAAIAYVVRRGLVPAELAARALEGEGERLEARHVVDADDVAEEVVEPRALAETLDAEELDGLEDQREPALLAEPEPEPERSKAEATSKADAARAAVRRRGMP